MVSLTDEQAQQITNSLLDCIPSQYQNAYNSIQVLMKSRVQDTPEKHIKQVK